MQEGWEGVLEGLGSQTNSFSFSGRWYQEKVFAEPKTAPGDAERYKKQSTWVAAVPSQTSICTSSFPLSHLAAFTAVCV